MYYCYYICIKVLLKVSLKSKRSKRKGDAPKIAPMLQILPDFTKVPGKNFK